MVDNCDKPRARRVMIGGMGLACSILTLSAAWAQPAPPAPPAAPAGSEASSAPPAAPPPAASKAVDPNGSAMAALTSLGVPVGEGQTQGQAGAAEAAAALAGGKDDEPHILNAPPPDAHRVYINDPAHFAAITQQFVVDGAKGRVIGVIDGGFLPNPVAADDGSMFAQVSTVFSRVARGTRTDYVEVFDPVTLRPTADIELPDAPRFLVGTYPWMSALTPDAKQLLFYQFSPSPSVGVVDLAAKSFARSFEVPDCYHIFPVSADTFFMHCRDGSLARVKYGGDAAPEITHSAVFHGEDEYLINHPAFSQKSGRLVWPSYTGRLYQFDLSSGEATPLRTVEALTDEERAQGWAPGGWQQVAYHRASDRVFLLVDQRDKWRHKTASRFVVVLNASTGERLAKLEMGHEIDSVAVSQDAEPLLYGLSTGDKTLYIYDADSGKKLRQVNQLGHGPQVITVADMG